MTVKRIDGTMGDGRKLDSAHLTGRLADKAGDRSGCNKPGPAGVAPKSRPALALLVQSRSAQSMTVAGRKQLFGLIAVSAQALRLSLVRATKEGGQGRAPTC